MGCRHLLEEINITKRRPARALALGILTVGLCAAWIPAANADDGGTSLSPDTVSAVIDHADSNQREKVVAPPAGADVSKGTVVSSHDVQVKTPATADGAVSVTSRHGTKSIAVGLPTKSKASAHKAGSGTITYGDASSDVTVGVRVFDSGVQISTVLESPQADHSFTYPVTLPAGAHIESTPNGGVVFLGANHTLLGGFAAPWAKDNKGHDVGTRYEILGHNVVQHVDAATSYPVVADPYLWIDLISSASWALHTEGWTLQVTPTGWARANAGGYLIGVYDWNELYSKYKNRGLDTNLDGMRDQLICHQQIVAIRSPRKATWNLDEWRPNVSYLQTVNASCNPGGSKWFD